MNDSRHGGEKARDAEVERWYDALREIARMPTSPDDKTNTITLLAAIKLAKATLGIL